MLSVRVINTIGLNLRDVVARLRQFNRGSASRALLETLLSCHLPEFPVVIVLLARVAVNTVHQRLARRTRQLSTRIVLTDGVASAGSRVLYVSSWAKKL